MLNESLNTPEGRLAYIEQHGHDAYNAAMKAHVAAETVDGVRPVQTRFGRLWTVEGTSQAFKDKADAIALAKQLGKTA